MNKYGSDNTRYEALCAKLGKLYESAGYRKFKMRKFEEYSLYLENKSFLGSESVITFNDPSGKLMALKPDVTLSIVKNARADSKSSEKVYYRENVYRLDRGSREFWEIDQMGLEFIGEIDFVQTAEILLLALRSLSAIDSSFVFALSHMGFIEGVLDAIAPSDEEARERILSCVRSKNAHDLNGVCKEFGLDGEKIEALKRVVSAPIDFCAALAAAESAVWNEETESAVNELKRIYGALSETPYKDKIRLDFSILNDIDYYNGAIFQGYAASCSKIVLSGGRYDRLLEKFEKRVGAMGFAIYLNEIEARAARGDFDADVLILYKDGNSLLALKRAETLRESGVSVLIAKERPEDMYFLKTEEI